MPGDEVMDYISIDDRDYHPAINPYQFRQTYQRVAHLRGLDLPEFYFSVAPGYVPDSVRFILPKEDRNVVRQWIRSSRDGDTSLMLYRKLKDDLFRSCHNNSRLCQFYDEALSTKAVNVINSKATTLRDSLQNDSVFTTEQGSFAEIISLSEKLTNSSRSISIAKYFPAFYWNGFNNQYHRWMKGLLYQKPLTSLVDGRNAWTKIYDALKWTLLLNGFAFLISIVLGVLIGIWSGTHDGRSSERIINWLLFGLFALPSFWLGTLFIYFFSSGEWLSILPAGGLGPYRQADNIFERWAIICTHLFLPVMCLALGALAYVSRQMKQSVMHEFTQPYVGMLRTQGVSEKTILRKHIIGNALFPVITMIGGAIPALLSGSLIIEVIFSIPGMGRLMYNSLMARDWPVAFPILMLGAAITILSYLVTDIVYKWLDPRVKVLQA